MTKIKIENRFNDFWGNMSHSFYKIWLHVIFSTKELYGLTEEEIKIVEGNG